MVRIKIHSMRLVLLGTCILTGVALSQEPETLRKGDEPVAVEIKEGVYRIGSVVLDENENGVFLKGEVNMQRGVVEYFACTRMGKLHESVLVLDVKPYQLQVALLLLGLEPGGNLEYQGDLRTPRGDSLEVWVEWEVDGKVKRHRAEDLVYNILEKKPMRRTPWIFTGSKIENGTFMADFEGSIIATYHDPYAIIDHPLPTGSDDTLYRANENLLPPKGTSVTVLLKPLSFGTRR